MKTEGVFHLRNEFLPNWGPIFPPRTFPSSFVTRRLYHMMKDFSSFYYVFKHDYKASVYSFPGGYWIELVPKSYCENNSNKKERSSLKNYCYFSCAFGWIRFKEIVFAKQTLLLKKKRLIGNSKVRYRNRNQFKINMIRSW